MRFIYLLLIVSFPLTSLCQSALFVPFGQSQSELDAYLDSRNYIRSQSRDHQDTLMSVLNDQHWVKYVLSDRILYSIEDVRIYTGEKEAERMIESCMEYLNLGNMRVRTLSNNGSRSHYAKVEGDRIVELIITRRGERKKRITTLRLKSTSRLYGPKEQTELVASRIIKN